MNQHDMKAMASDGDDVPRILYPFSPAVVPGVVRLLDSVMIVIAAIISSLYYFSFSTIIHEYYSFCIIFIIFSYNFIANHGNLFEINVIMRPLRRADDLLVALLTSFLLLLAIAFSLKVSENFSRLWMFSFAGLTFLGIFAGRVATFWILQKLSSHSVIGRNVVVLGVGAQAQRFVERHRKTQPYFSRVVGAFAADLSEAHGTVGGVAVRGGLDALLGAARDGAVDDIVVALPWNADREVIATIEKLKELPVNVYLSSDLVGFELAFRPALGAFSEMPMFEVTTRPISGWSSALKALEDYVLATILLILLSPLLLLIAAAVKIDSPGPVFFKQKRLGFNNQVFEIFKFRSMYHREIPESVVRQATRGDPRVTRVGRIIRATSLDELPQLLNVLTGDMSLVGPRPHALSHNEEYGRHIRSYFARHRVKPGITGWAQVKGFRGETETLDKMAARIEHDIYYAENWSIFFDVKILFMTAFVVLFQKSAY